MKYLKAKGLDVSTLFSNGSQEGGYIKREIGREEEAVWRTKQWAAMPGTGEILTFSVLRLPPV